MGSVKRKRAKRTRASYMSPTEIRTSRLDAGFTTEGMAQRLHVALRTFTRWERGESPVPYVYAEAIREITKAKASAKPDDLEPLTSRL